MYPNDDQDLLVNSPFALCICPLCGAKARVAYPYDTFITKHKHPIRRFAWFFLTGRNYGAWYNDYLKRLERVNGTK